MSTAVDRIAKALLYEGYMLYPYRPSAIKNRDPVKVASARQAGKLPLRPPPRHPRQSRLGSPLTTVYSFALYRVL